MSAVFTFIGAVPAPAGLGVALLWGLLARYIVAGLPGCTVRIGSFRGRAGETGKRRRMAGRVLTGGGGMLRDMLVSEVPAVLRGELYASAALTGATVVVVTRLLHLPTPAGAIPGAVLCFALRYLAIRRGWRLPVAEHPLRRAADQRAEGHHGGGNGHPG